MKPQRWLLDSDAAKCMCKYRLVDELAAALGVDLTALCILPQLRFQLRLHEPRKALSKLGSADAVAQATRLVEHAAEVTVLTDSANLALLEATPDIDGGELALFAALLDAHDSGLITGDKRAIIALSGVSGISADHAVWMRLLCTEDAIAMLVQHFGHDHVSAKIRACPDTNMAVSIAFGRSAPNSPECTHEGLRSYILDLVTCTGGRYIPQHVSGAPTGP